MALPTLSLFGSLSQSLKALGTTVASAYDDAKTGVTNLATQASLYLEGLQKQPDLSSQTQQVIADALEKIKANPGIAGTALAAILIPVIYSVGTKYMRKRASSQRRHKQFSEERRRSASKRAKANAKTKKAGRRTRNKLLRS